MASRRISLFFVPTPNFSPMEPKRSERGDSEHLFGKIGLSGRFKCRFESRFKRTLREDGRIFYVLSALVGYQPQRLLIVWFLCKPRFPQVIKRFPVSRGDTSMVMPMSVGLLGSVILDSASRTLSVRGLSSAIMHLHWLWCQLSFIYLLRDNH